MNNKLNKKTFPVFDGHNDLLLQLWMQSGTPVEDFLHGTLPGQLDYARIRRGGFAGGLFAIFVPPAQYVAQKLNIPLEQAQRQTALEITERQMALLHELVNRSRGRARLCLNVAEIEDSLHDGAIAMVMHIEGAAALDADLSQLEGWYQSGLRSIGPFWNLPNAFGEGITGSFPGSPDSGSGLTQAGRRLIQACNRRGIMLDVSHMNQKAFFDTAELSDAPLVASHSNAHAICPQPRNLTDEQLAAIAASDGFVGVNFGNAFLRDDGRRISDTPLTQVVRHIDYLLEKLGEDRVGFGSDFDGTQTPDALSDVAALPGLIDALRQAGYPDALLEKLSWRNWLRVLKRCWR
ncbi:peptidase [Erwinia sp. CPCC 100877]|nr:peptidase [Erwinia sp. CPCC 100877]